MGFSVRKTSAALAAILLLGALTGARGQYLEATIPVGDTPTLLFWNPLSNRVYCSNEQSGTVTIIDGGTSAVRATVDVADYPSNYGFAARHNKVYCASGMSNRVNVICGSGDTLVKRLRVYDYPQNMAYSEERDLLYVVRYDAGQVDVFDAAVDTVVASIGMSPAGSIQAVWNRASGRLFCANQAGRYVAVVDCSTNSIVRAWQLGVSLRGLLSSCRDGRTYASSARALHVLNATGDSLVATVAVAAFWPTPLVHYPRLDRLYVMDLNLGQGSVVDCPTNTVIDSLPSTAVYDAVCDTLRGKLYVIDRSTDQVLVYRLADNVHLSSIQLGRSPVCMAWNPIDSRVYVSDQMDNVVFVIRDTSTAVAEEATDSVVQRASSRIVHGVLDLPATGVGRQASSVLVNAAGSKVANLRPGLNDVSRLSSGVYFIRRLGPSEPADLERVLLVR
ncbi:MAG: YncE family protein [bacterium]